MGSQGGQAETRCGGGKIGDGIDYLADTEGFSSVPPITLQCSIEEQGLRLSAQALTSSWKTGFSGTRGTVEMRSDSGRGSVLMVGM